MAEKRKFTITYIRTLTLEETVEVDSLQEAERIAEQRAWESCELLNNDFTESDTQFEVEPQDECEGCEQSVPQSMLIGRREPMNGEVFALCLKCRSEELEATQCVAKPDLGKDQIILDYILAHETVRGGQSRHMAMTAGEEAVTALPVIEERSTPIVAGSVAESLTDTEF